MRMPKDVDGVEACWVRVLAGSGIQCKGFRCSGCDRRVTSKVRVEFRKQQGMARPQRLAVVGSPHHL